MFHIQDFREQFSEIDIEGFYDLCYHLYNTRQKGRVPC